MSVSLHSRSAETVAVYFEKAQHPVIRKVLPQKAQTVEDAVADFKHTQLPGATSYGRTIQCDNRYVGDVWCYAIDRTNTPNAMLSYCVFELDAWGRGVATEAVRLFLVEAQKCFDLRSIGAFTYAENHDGR